MMEAREGSPETLLDRLTEYVDFYDPGWSSRVRGVDADTVQAYRVAAELSMPLPASYLRWLAFAGADDGGLLTKNLRVEAAISDLLDYHADCRKFDETIEPTLPVVLMRQIGDQMSFALDGSDEPTLRETAEGENVGYFAESWEHLLFQCAVHRYAERGVGIKEKWYGSSVNGVREALALSEADSVRELVESVLQKQGVDEMWFSDKAHVYAKGPELMVLVDIRVRGALVMKVLGKDDALVEELGTRMALTMGLAI